MKLTDLFLEQLAREADGTRKVLERVPSGRADWKPHEKSMSLGRLANLVASMPSWITMMVKQDFLDIQPPGGAAYKQEELASSSELVAALDRHVAAAREALANTTDEHLMTKWQFRVGGHVADEQPRYVMIRDAVMTHLAHHRGQLTVYLRLNEAKVPSIYGPSADEGGV